MGFKESILRDGSTSRAAATSWRGYLSITELISCCPHAGRRPRPGYDVRMLCSSGLAAAEGALRCEQQALFYLPRI